MSKIIMEIVIIAAVSENGVIGREGRLPWRIPEDMKRLKQMTIGHTLIMGRRTFESLGRPLSGRTSIVITSQKDYKPEGVVVAHSLEGALEKCKDEIAFIFGGQSVFEAALPVADRLELTLVHRVVEGDVYFPPIGGEWKEVGREDHEGFSFVTYRKK